MKNLFVFAIVAVALTFFSGCQKEEIALIGEQPQEVVTELMFEGLNNIAFSVEENRLVFETEEEFQKCINLLDSSGTESFLSFEQEVGFQSLRSSSISKGEVCPIEDDLFATLLNEKMEIVVEQYLFKLDNEKEKVTAYFVGEDFDLKSVDMETSNMQEFGYDDNVFAILKEEEILKSATTSYCGQENSENILSDGTRTIVDYNKYGIYNSLVSKMYSFAPGTAIFMKHETINSPLGTVPSGITSRCFYKRSAKQNNIIWASNYVYDDYISKTLWKNTRRLVGFRLDMKYSYYFYSNPNVIYHDTNMIECHQY